MADSFQALMEGMIQLAPMGTMHQPHTISYNVVVQRLSIAVYQ